MGSRCLIANLLKAGRITKAEAKQALANRKAKQPPPTASSSIDPERIEHASRAAAAFDYEARAKAREAL